MTGETIAHYQMLEKLGEGGMGVVYKARDMHLDRFVALKILPAAKVSDPDRRRRFVQEAKSASALNHTNIVTIYDIDAADGVHFIAMEYVQGKTLDRLIGRKGLPLGEALHYSIQIADALARAHAAGIVHRDLKPGNVMVTADGVVKVLDFGLAKLAEPAETGGDAATATAAMGGEAPATEEGVIIGTISYMSPEQAQGKPVDARSDIFSFGTVFYEMLTGRRAFSGETKLSTLAAILHKEPASASEIAAPLPPEVERLLTKCLRKDLQRRWQTMSDLKVALQDLKEESDSGKLGAAISTPGARPRQLRLFVPLALVLVAAAASVAWWFSRGVRQAAEPEVARLTFDAGLTWDPAISPDGKLAAYASDRSGDGNLDIWVQQITGRQPMRLTRHEADDWQPSFSPDGSRIVFRSERDGGGIYVVDALGGAERKIADGGYWPRFSPDGSVIVFASVSAYGRVGTMFLVPSDGGPPQPFQPGFTAGSAFSGFYVPLVWSPDGKFLLFDGMRGQDRKTRDWWVAPVHGGDPIATGALRSLPPTEGNRYPCAWIGKHVLFAQGTMAESINIYRVPITPGSWQIKGTPERLTSGPGAHMHAAVAADGRLLFPNVQGAIDIWSIALNANQGKTSGEPQPVTRDSAMKFGMSASRDGSKLAYVEWAGERVQRRLDVRLRDMASGREVPISAKGLSLALTPRLSPDGSVLSYRDLVDGKPVSYAVTGEGASVRQLCEGCTVLAFFSDGNQALVSYAPDQIVRQNLATGARLPVLRVSASPFDLPALSPDDRWIAFTTGKPDGATAMFVAPVKEQPAAEQDWIPIAEDRRYLASPQWSPDGSLLYYVSARDDNSCVWAQRFDPATGKPAGEPFAVFHSHRLPAIRLMPSSGRTIAVTKDRLIYVVGEVKGNIWMTRVDVK